MNFGERYSMAKKRKNDLELKSLAWAVSRVFDPVIEIPVLIATAMLYAMNSGWRFRYLVFLLVIDALLPAAYMLWGLAHKTISDWDMTKKDERKGLYVFTVLAHLFGVVYAYMLGKDELAEILFVFWWLAVVFAVVTLFWKISVHAGVNGAALAFFNHFWGWDNYWWLLIVLLLVLWARVEIKKHTWSQVLIGATTAIVIVELGLRLVGM